MTEKKNFPQKAICNPSRIIADYCGWIDCSQRLDEANIIGLSINL